MPGILLVHGFTGSCRDFDPLYENLSDQYGSDSIIRVRLPFHGRGQKPDFDAQAFEKTIWQAANRFAGQKLVFIGHSTGGIMVLSCMEKYGILPDLLVLAAVPKNIQAHHLNRWETLDRQTEAPSFTCMAKMISLVNKTGKKKECSMFPVLVLAAEKDRLVPEKETRQWQGHFPGETRFAVIKEADHQMFSSQKAADDASRIIGSVIDRFENRFDNHDKKVLAFLEESEPQIIRFFKKNPGAKTCLSRIPGSRRAAGLERDLPERVPWLPVFANIEITTRCNLSCRFCARTRMNIKGKDMSLPMFSTILEKLPSAYRITLVGLGEPLMHPEIADMVRLAKDQGRHVGLVTNAAALDEKLSEQLLAAGMDSIAFSLDSTDEKSAAHLRCGTDIRKVIRNIKGFVRLSETVEKQIAKAVFCAVSITSLPGLEDLADQVADFGVDVLMLSDLNFEENQTQTLWQHMDDEKIKILKKAVSLAFSRNLPVLSVRALEEFGLRKRYRQFLAAPVSGIYARSKQHAWCLSPWQTLPVTVDGNISICDCQPSSRIGNLLTDSFDRIWNHSQMAEHRRQMKEHSPPGACRICPRF